MGAGASSSSVRRIRINSASLRDPRKDKDGLTGSNTGLTKLGTRRTSTEDPPKTPGTAHDDQQQTIQSLQKQLTVTESARLDLLDRISLLESQIEYLTTQRLLASQQTGCEETIHAKDQYIAKLEKETEAAQEEAKKLRLKIRRKVRCLSTQLTEAKQEASIQLLELRDEISRPTEENSRCQEKLRLCDTPRTESRVSDRLSDRLPPIQCDDGRSKLILGLSQQLNEQSEQIERLETQLSERDVIIKDLREELSRTGARQKQDSKAAGALTVDPDRVGEGTKHSSCLPTDCGEGIDASEILPNRHTDSTDSDMTELKFIMSEMKSLQRQKRRPRDKVEKSGVGEREAVRGSSGQSRDSGVESPTGNPRDRPLSAVSSLSGASVTHPGKHRTDDPKIPHSAPVGSVRSKPPINLAASKKSNHIDSCNIEMDRDKSTQPQHLAAKRKKRFLLKQRLPTETESEKTDTKRNSFTDSDVDMESEMLLESFKQDPMFSIHRKNPCLSQVHSLASPLPS